MYEEITPNLTRYKEERGDPFISPNSLRKDLETELRSDSKDIRSYAWFHGRIPRDISEQLLRSDGDFLIRESISSTGELVLTMKWGVVMHFMIKKNVLQQSSSYSKIQYAFEQGGFDSIPALIMYHKGNKIPISVQSGAIIQTPVNREVPLSFSDVKYASIRRTTKSNGNSATSRTHNSNSPHSKENTPTGGFVLMQTDHQSSSARTMDPSIKPTFAADVKHRSNPNPFPLHIGDVQQPAEASSSDRMSPSRNKNGTKPQALASVGTFSSMSEPTSGVPLFSSQHRTPRSEVPPKPSRVASFRRPIIRHVSSRASKSSMVDKTTAQLGGEGPSPSSPISSEASPLRSSIHQLDHKEAPEFRSIFNPALLNSSLLPNQNKPVDGDAMLEVKSILLGTDSFKLARHMTYKDCEVCKVMDLGLEDIFLSKGKQFRKDLLERYQSLSFWVAVSILRGGSTKDEQIKILNVFIMVANELVHSLGNVYGFSAIMHGLTCPQIRGLDDLWAGLQQQYTNNAVTMENKLVPLLRLLDEGKGQINTTSTCIPHIIPLLRFFENPLNQIPHSQNTSRASDRKQLSASEGNIVSSVASSKIEKSNWWENIPDDSFDSLMAQLSIARSILSSLSDFKTKFIEKFKEFDKKSIIFEIFDTEFHLRLLWGHKGSGSPQRERHEKFDKVISVMAKKQSG